MTNVYDNVHEAYLSALEDVYFSPEYTCSPRGLRIREKMYYQFTVLNPVSEPIVTLDEDRNKTIESYTKKELEWYKSGSLLVEDAKKISKFWGNLANPDGTINSNYGHLVLQDISEGNPAYENHGAEILPSECEYGMRTPWQWAKRSLLLDESSRQAVVRFNKPIHCYKGNKDFVCTMYGNFHIRDNKLMFAVRMRSSDLHYGLVFDMPFFIYLQDRMLQEIKPEYPNLKIGSFTFSADSIHIYERSFDVVLRMLGAERAAA